MLKNSIILNQVTGARFADVGLMPPSFPRNMLPKPCPEQIFVFKDPLVEIIQLGV